MLHILPYTILRPTCSCQSFAHSDRWPLLSSGLFRAKAVVLLRCRQRFELSCSFSFTKLAATHKIVVKSTPVKVVLLRRHKNIPVNVDVGQEMIAVWIFFGVEGQVGLAVDASDWTDLEYP